MLFNKTKKNIQDYVYGIWKNEMRGFSTNWVKRCKFVARDPIDNISPLVRVMAWRRTCDKPSSEPIITQFTYE